MTLTRQQTRTKVNFGRELELAALMLLLLMASLGNAQIRTAGTWGGVSRGNTRPGRPSPRVVSGGSLTLSMTGPASLSIDITSRMGTASNPMNNGNPINLTATWNNVDCSPAGNCNNPHPPTFYLYAYVPSTGLTGPGTYSIPATALEASTTASNFAPFATQTFGNIQSVTPPGPAFLISQQVLGWNPAGLSGIATATLYMNLNLSAVTSLPAGSYTGVLSIRAAITQ